MTKENNIPEKLEEIIEDFQFGEGREKIELLIDFAERMPEVPPALQEDQESFDLVEECMTPVYVKAQLENGGMVFYFNVPQESPTVRGFASIMAQGINGSTPEEVLAIPNVFFLQMGLESVLTMQRLNGFSAILAHMKRLAAQYLEV